MSILNNNCLDFQLLFSSNCTEFKVTLNYWVTLCTNYFFNICVEKLLHNFLLHRHFPGLLQVNFFLWKCTVNQTRDDKLCQLCGTTGTMSARRLEPWTLSKRFSLERRRLMYFKTIKHLQESDSNSETNWAVSVIKYIRI